MADVAVVFGWGWAELRSMPVEELLAFRQLAEERVGING